MPEAPVPDISDPVISYGSGLGLGWHSHRIGEVTLAMLPCDGCISFRTTVYVNVRVPTSLPTWPRALSLRPDLSARRN